MNYLRLMPRPSAINVRINVGTLSQLNCTDSYTFTQQKRHASYGTVVTDIWTSISRSTPVAYFQQGLIDIHDFTGLPWWASIIFSTILMRTIVTFPLAVYQNKIVARLEQITLEMPSLVEQLKRETALAVKKFHWSEAEARIMYNRSLKTQWDKLVVRENCHPAKTMIVLWGQIPLWIVMSVSLRNIAHMLPDPTSVDAQVTFAELSLGGFGWIPNLIEVDQSLILPVAMGLINITIVEIQSASRTKASSKVQKIFTNLFRGLCIVMVPVAATVPSCLCLYWVTSSAYGLGQNLLLMSPRFKRLVGVPRVPSEIAQPYKHIKDSLAGRFSSLLGKVKTDSK